MAGYKNRWYREWFGEEYLSVYAHRNLNDAKKLIDLIKRLLILKTDDLLLDVGCGSARHVKLLARNGFKVVGMDLSRSLLNSAMITKNNKFPVLIQADMRHLPFKGLFDAVLSLFTSFGYFKTDEMNLNVLREFNYAVKKGGNVLVDFLNPEYVAANLEPYSEKKSGKLSIQETRWIDEGRVFKKIVIDESKEFQESVRLYTLAQMQDMFKEADLKITGIYGDYDGNHYAVNSERMIIQATR